MEKGAVRWNLVGKIWTLNSFSLDIPVGQDYTQYLGILSLSVPTPLIHFTFFCPSLCPTKNDLCVYCFPSGVSLLDASNCISPMRGIGRRLKSRGRETRIFLPSSLPHHLWQLLFPHHCLLRWPLLYSSSSPWAQVVLFFQSLQSWW